MKLESTIIATVADEREVYNIRKLFETEDTEIGNGRASYTLEVEGVSVRFVVTAQDPVALRATLNAITKLLSVYIKMELTGD